MEEFKPDSDFRPDSSDRPGRATRSSYGSSLFSRRSFPLSRQHMMIGLGALVLLLLIIGIGSALKGPPKSPASSGAAREIHLDDAAQNTPPSETGSPEVTTPGTTSPETVSPDTVSPDTTQSTQPPVQGAQELPVPPPVATTPTEAAEPPHTVQRRVELSGNLSTALTHEQGPVDQVVQEADGGLPTGPATLSDRVEKPKVKEKSPAKEQEKLVRESKTGKPESRKAEKTEKTEKSRATAQEQSLPAGNYTLQLSGASRSESLNAFARKNNLSHYRVYETRRDGKPWYVLISGSYASQGEARKAAESLPADVKALKPWAKPMKQVRRELQQR
ncbi:MAG: SPOR domain-containing protein [Enterobacteriaceae bacterium]